MSKQLNVELKEMFIEEPTFQNADKSYLSFMDIPLQGIDGCVVNRDSERSMFRQVLMHPSKSLMIRLPPRWIFLLIQPNSSTSISID
ncbi:UNVERIFIED_CONTAM: hypothetical protein NCL1_14037 [Trichonephila clavipes]